MESPKSPRVSTTRYTLGKRFRNLFTFRRSSKNKRRGAMTNKNRKKLENAIIRAKPPKHPGIPVASRGRTPLPRVRRPPPPQATVEYSNNVVTNPNNLPNYNEELRRGL